MYEIETKFEYTKKIKEALLQRASFIKKEVLEDTYFDTDTWELLSKDRWLRTRNSQWELKLPQHETGNINVRNVDNYHEIEGEEKILLALGIQKSLKHIFKPKISL